MKGRQCCRRYITVNNVLLFLTIVGILSSTFSIVYFSIKLYGMSQYAYLYSYRSATCKPVTGMAYNLSCDEGLSVRWISILQLDNGLQTVENPFATRTTRSDAVTDRDKIELYTNYSCVCRFSIITKNAITKSANTDKRIDQHPLQQGCSLWTSCILNADFVRYMQRDNDRYHDTFISFIAVSCVSVLLSAVGIPFSIIIMRRDILTAKYIPLTEETPLAENTLLTKIPVPIMIPPEL